MAMALAMAIAAVSCSWSAAILVGVGLDAGVSGKLGHHTQTQLTLQLQETAAMLLTDFGFEH